MPAHFNPTTDHRWIVSRVAFFLGIGLMVLVYMGILVTAFIRWLAEGVAVGLFGAIGLDVHQNPQWLYPLLAYVGCFALPVIAFLPVLAALALTWKSPHRIVVFRRFHTRYESRVLRRIAAQFFGRFGHVFTLADSQIHQRLWLRIPVVLGQLSFLQFHLQTVHSERGLGRLRRLLGRRWRLNLNWMVSFRKIFPVVSSDEFWQPCVEALLENADLVVMDISSLSDSLDWEIAQCSRRGLLPKTVLLIHQDHAADGDARRETFEKQLGPAMESLFRYGDKGVERRDDLLDRIAEILAPPGRWEGRTPVWQVMATIAATLMTALAVTAGGLGLAAPYLDPYTTGLSSPIKSQVLTSFYQIDNQAILSRLMSMDPEWTLSALRKSASDGYGRALMALAEVGETRDIGLMVNRISALTSSDDEQAWTRLIRWPNVKSDALLKLVQRLGRPAFDPLLQAIASAPRLAYDGSLYREYIWPYGKDLEAARFEPLLACPNQFGRFLVALELGSRKDPRAIPNLLEIVRQAPSRGLGTTAAELLNGYPRIPLRQLPMLDPYILGADEAAERATRLAAASDNVYLARILRNPPGGTGQSLLKILVEYERDEEPGLTQRARALLAGASAAWLRSLFSDHSGEVRLNAARVFAERGDPGALAVLLAAPKMETECEAANGKGSYPCNYYVVWAVEGLELLRARLRPPRRLAVDTAAIAGLPETMLASLVQLASQAGDEETANRVRQTATR